MTTGFRSPISDRYFEDYVPGAVFEFGPISVDEAEIVAFARKDALLKHPTLDQLHALGLHGMAKAFDEITASGEADGLSPLEWLGLLLDREASWRQDKRFAARLRVAKLRQQACPEDIDYRTPRGLDRALFQKLVEGGWIDAHDNLALIGPTDVGKSWLASALGHKACRDNRSVLYQRVPRLFEELALARGDGRHARLVAPAARSRPISIPHTRDRTSSAAITRARG